MTALIRPRCASRRDLWSRGCGVPNNERSEALGLALTW